jgi:hypothetical protein
MGQIDSIAESIFNTEFYEEVGTPEYIQQRKVQISAWLETNIGQLNILINEGFRVDENNDACPVLKNEEIAIFIQLYLKYYYKRQSQSILKNLTTTTTSGGESSSSMSEWTQLREGDSSITRVAQNASPQQKVQVAQTYKTFAEEADIKLSELVHSYNMYKSSPRQVAGNEASSEDCTPEASGCDTESVQTESQVQPQVTSQEEGQSQSQDITFFSQDE